MRSARGLAVCVAVAVLLCAAATPAHAMIGEKFWLPHEVMSDHEGLHQGLMELERRGYVVDAIDHFYNPPKELHHHLKSRSQVAEFLQTEEEATFPDKIKDPDFLRDVLSESKLSTEPTEIDLSSNRKAQSTHVRMGGRLLRHKGFAVTRFLGAGSFGAVVRVKDRNNVESAVKFNIEVKHSDAEELGLECEYMIQMKKLMGENRGNIGVMYANDLQSGSVLVGSRTTLYYGFCFMPVMAGDLEDYIVKDVNPDPAKHYVRALQITRTLIYGVWWILNTMNDLHTDLKPVNIFYERIESFPYILPRVADFGGSFMRKKGTNMCPSDQYPMWLTSLGYQDQHVLAKLITKAEKLNTADIPTVCVIHGEKQPIWALAMITKELVCGTAKKNGRDIPFTLFTGWKVDSQKTLFNANKDFLAKMFPDSSEITSVEDWTFLRFMQRSLNPCPSNSSSLQGLRHTTKDCVYYGDETNTHMGYNQQYVELEAMLLDEWVSHYRGTIKPPPRLPYICTIGA